MSRTHALLVLFAVAVAACERRGPNPAESRAHAALALRNVLAYPQSSVVSVSSGNEAAEMMLSSPAPVDVIVQWYREFLPLNKWTIKTNSRARAATVSIHVERDARTLWHTFRPNLRAGRTIYGLPGVFNIDST